MRDRCVTARLSAVGAVLLLVLAIGAAAQEPVDNDINWQIRREATANSQILRTLHHLTDVYGPRLTGSPNLARAGEWAVQELERWGLKNGRLEPWDFGHPGWLNERLSAHLVAPVRDHLVGEVLAWTPGTDGVVRAEAVQIAPPERPSEAELEAFAAEMAPAVAGKIVLVGPHERVPVTFSKPPLRREESDLRAEYDPDREIAPGPAAPAGPAQPAEDERLSSREVDRRLNELLVEAGARVRLNDAGRDHGQIRAFSNRTYDVTKAPPTVVLRNEDYGRISRLLAAGRTVELEIDIVSQTNPEGRTQHNVVAEIPGTDLAGEVVMLGAHLDSWHAATGTTDNGIGCAVVMEAVRILQAVGVRPRRTIRLALWTGEEQGLLGSQAYVREHFGTFESPKPAYDSLSAYVNIDSGTGRVRGALVFGPQAAAAVLRAALAPFEDLGVVGAAGTASRRRGGSDHTSFNEAGLPGISMRQDPIEYRTATWHTNLDTYERAVLEDAIKSATVIAATVYHLAARDERLPRFDKETMPALPASTDGQ